MVFCIVAIVVFALLGLFSARYRTYAKEAWRCVRRTVILKPCDTDFDQRMKSKITAKLMTRSPKLAKIVFNKFQAISFIFVVITLASLGYTAYSLGNLLIFGTCDPANPGQCFISPQNPNKAVCPFDNLKPENAVPSIGGFMAIPDAEVSGRPKVYFFGATWCPHCKWERPIFLNATQQFESYIELIKVELDVEPNSEHAPVFAHFSKEGDIPLIIFGGKYFRTGSGELLGAEQDENVLAAILCEITSNPIEKCKSAEIVSLAGKL